MKRYFILGLALVLSISWFPTLTIADEKKLQESSRIYIIKLSNGGKVTWMYKWAAYFDSRIWETGRPASIDPTNFHPLDTRRCHWEIKRRIERQKYLFDLLTGRAPSGDKDIIWSDEQTKRSDYKRELGRARNCGEDRGKASNQISEYEQLFSSEFHNKVEEDAIVLQKMIGKMAKVVSVNVE